MLKENAKRDLSHYTILRCNGRCSNNGRSKNDIGKDKLAGVKATKEDQKKEVYLISQVIRFQLNSRKQRSRVLKDG